MKAYKVTVNGNTYEITLEIIDKSEVKAPAAEAAPAEKRVSAAPSATGSTQVKAPMPGTVLKVNVAVGQAVKKGDVLIVLEAMKMENEILAQADGTVASVNVKNGESVETGVLLCTLN